MAEQPLPAVFSLIDGVRNVALDAALVEALPTLEPDHQARALRVLADREHPPSLATIFGRFREYDEGLRMMIVSHVGRLSAGVRLAAQSTSAAQRVGALQVIVESECSRLFYLLPQALRSTCAKTRESAANGLYLLTGRLMHANVAAMSEQSPAPLAERRAYLAEALSDAVLFWEAHLKPKVLLAALWMVEWVEPAIREKLAERTSNLGRAIGKVLEGTSDPALAGLALRALAIEPLRAAAVRAIGHAPNRKFLRALGAESWLLADTAIRHACLRIRRLKWLEDCIEEIPTFAHREAVGLIRLVQATGESRERRIEFLRSITGFGDDALEEAAVWQLVADTSEVATCALAMMVNRTGGAARRIASREMRRRRPEIAIDTGDETRSAEGETIESPATWDRVWTRFDVLSDDERVAAKSALLHSHGTDVPRRLRAKIASGNPDDRARALRIVRELGLTQEFSEQTFHLARDADDVVRATAVAMLAELPGVTTRRILREAVNDRDARVQANAIESLDTLEIAQRGEWIQPKLDADNGRVRANAIKSLLGLEVRSAGEALLAMLESGSAAHRQSALWVVEHLRLRAVVHRLTEMSRQDPDNRVRRRAQRTLQALGGGALGAEVGGAPPRPAGSVSALSPGEST
ncbi:MAG: HEAT repeat domain-containing protein [Planctomycetes bacterium]|nr:HEAT repeat domain-containing protein [Planctomycetota bacterium]